MKLPFSISSYSSTCFLPAKRFCVPEEGRVRKNDGIIDQRDAERNGNELCMLLFLWRGRLGLRFFWDGMSWEILLCFGFFWLFFSRIRDSGWEIYRHFRGLEVVHIITGFERPILFIFHSGICDWIEDRIRIMEIMSMAF